jgi:penicillin-binding protein 2
LYNRRIKTFLALITLVFLGVAGRLWHLQIVRGQEYRLQIEQDLQKLDILPASRGQILDRQGAVLAIDEPCFEFCLDYRLLFSWVNSDPNAAFAAEAGRWRERRKRELIKSGAAADRQQAQELYDRRVADTWRAARELVGGSGEELYRLAQRIVERVEAIRAAMPDQGKMAREQTWSHPVATGLDQPTAVDLKARLDQMIGASVRPSFKRRYPYGNFACHVIGVTGEVSAEEQERFNLPPERADPTTRQCGNYLGGDAIGKSGVERMCEPTLRGRRGCQRRHKASGEILEDTPAVQGRNVPLTLDIGLQEELTRLFPAGASGCIVVLSVPRGEVLAMVSMPTFDLNRYRSDFKALAADEVYFPLRHRAVSQLYPPGSTVKPLVALAALGDGAVARDRTFECTGYLVESDPNRWRCWTVKHGMPGHGAMNVYDGLKNSCNVYFYHLGQELGAERLAHWLSFFGFTAASGTGLMEDRAGLIDAKASISEARLMAIGQGPLAATPLHVANAMAAVARGSFYSPVLVLEGGPQQVRKPLLLRQADLEAVREGMRRVVNEPGGTAYRVFHGEGVERLGTEVCGKTGTATVASQKVEGGEDRTGDMAWFAGYAPFDGPQIALAVVVEYVEGGAAANAGPVAREAVRVCIKRGYIR